MIINLYVVVLTFVKIYAVYARAYTIELSSDSPVVRGGTVHFVAKVLDEYGTCASGKFKYDWEDNSIRKHMTSHTSTSCSDTWNVTYSANDFYPPGPYEVQVTLQESIFWIYYKVTSQRETFVLTELLNGKLELIQNGKVIDSNFISNTVEVTYRVVLSASDAEYVNATATSVVTYWFIDCVYYGMSDNYMFTQKYTEVDKEHKVEALVVASHEPITTLAPITTPAPTTAAPVTTVKPNVTTTTTAAATTTKRVFPITTSKPIPTTKKITKRSVDDKITLVPHNGSFPFVCLGNNSVAPDVNKTYGHFSRKFIARAPVTNISVTGNYWLHKGDVLHLMVKCKGSPQFYYCKHIYEGVYNVTGNETCDVPPADSSNLCEFPITRYLFRPQKYTIAIVIYNEIGKIVSPVTVTVYEVTQQAQLSVIVVPVSFCLVAVVLIVFGVAYYMQNRSRYTVEVADFNFGQDCNDMEYKTFRERLYDSVTNAFMRAPTPSSSEPTVWPPGRKYGSLT